MFIRINQRGYVVEATDNTFDDDYIEVQGSVAETMPLGLLGFNGRAYTPSYIYIDGAIVPRTTEEMARDPYSDDDEGEA